MHDTLAKCILAFDAGLAECHRSEDRALVSTYLASLAPVLAKCTVGSDVLGDLQSIERLFGNSWVIDEKPFLSALNYWREFKTSYERFSLSAMTVNERLFALQLLDEFAVAEDSNNTELMEALLRRIYLDERSIEEILHKAQPGSQQDAAR
jgi:hypothetical protein